MYLWLSEYFELRRIMGYIPGPKTFPFVGLSWQLSNIPVEGKISEIRKIMIQC